MNKRIRVWPLLIVLLAFCTVTFAQQKTKPDAKPTSVKQQSTTQQKNIEEYIELIKSDVRQEKAQVLGAVMQFSAGDAAKFWPVYSQYDSELSKLNKLRSDNILEYARVYDNLTDAKADELIKTAAEYQKLRTELLTKYYGQVRDSIGAIQAARFVQIENQLLTLIDLQIASNLPLFETADAPQEVKK
jgi:hypothetical protein